MKCICLLVSCWAWALALLVFSNACLAHPFHTTTAEMEFNPDTKRFEVSLKISASDFEQMVQSAARRPMSAPASRNGARAGLPAETHERSIDSPSEPSIKNKAEQSVANYIQRRFSVSVAGELCRFEWVGMEEEQLNRWVYFELIPSTEHLRSLQLTNEVGFDTNNGHINTVVFISNSMRASVKTHEQTPSVALPDVY